jgi:hypothetical protein
MVRLVPPRSRRFWALVTIVHFGVVIGVVVPVGMAVLSGTPLFGTTGAAPVEPTSPQPSGTVAAPLPVVGGLESGAAPTSESTPKSTPKPTPKPTPDTRRPTITGRTPGPAAVNVPGNSTIRILFSEPVRNVSDATIQLINAQGGWLVRSTVRYDASRRTATLTPDLRMYPNTDYRVTIMPGIMDRAGNGLSPRSWTLRVGSR